MSNGGAYVSLAFATKTIETQQCDRMAAFDMGRDHQLTRAEGKWTHIVEEVERCYHNVSGVFRVEVWKHRPGPNGQERVGQKSTATAPLIFLLGSRAFANEDGPRSDPREVGDYGRRRDAHDDDEEEEEEEEGPAKMSEFQQEILKMVAPLAAQLVPKLMGLLPGKVNGTPAPQAVAMGGPVEGNNVAPPKGPHPGEMSKLAKAIARAQKENPAGFAAIKEHLLTTYGEPEQ